MSDWVCGTPPPKSLNWSFHVCTGGLQANMVHAATCWYWKHAQPQSSVANVKTDQRERAVTLRHDTKQWCLMCNQPSCLTTRARSWMDSRCSWQVAHDEHPEELIGYDTEGCFLWTERTWQLSFRFQNVTACCFNSPLCPSAKRPVLNLAVD